jgi:TolB-like protein
MRALAAHGDAPGARRHARIHEELVQNELGGAPDPAVAALAARLATEGPELAQPDGTVHAAPVPEPVPTHAGHAGVGERDTLEVDGVPTPSSTPGLVPYGRASARSIGRVTAVLCTVVAVVLSALAWSRRSAAGDPPAASVAILPFRLATADPSLAWLREGMVDLLALRLRDGGGLQVTDPALVLNAWRGVAPEVVRPDAGRRAAAVLGVARVIEGSVTAVGGRVVLSASVLAMPKGTVLASATAEGPNDSLLTIVERLAATLLGRSAGVEGPRLGALTSASLPAVREYLHGRSAWRAGRREDAAPHFRAAVELDSTFALAGLALARAAWKDGSEENFYRGRAVARANLDRLGGADRALLAVTTPDWEWESAPEMYAAWNEAVQQYPELPELWYGLGDVYYRLGMLAGVDRYLERAEDAFEKGWVLDSARSPTTMLDRPAPIVAEPLLTMVELAQRRGDVRTVLRLTALGLAADSVSDLALALRWHRAVAGRESRRDFWRGLDGGSWAAILPIFMFTTWSGIGGEDHPLATAAMLRRLRAHDPGILQSVRRSTALNGGRPQQARATYEESWSTPRTGLRMRVHYALAWNGDTASAREAMRTLAPLADAGPTNAGDVIAHAADVCTVARWRVAAGDPRAAEPAIAHLRAATYAGAAPATAVAAARVGAMCAAVLEAQRATALGLPDARVAVATADSLARTWVAQVCCYETISDANLVLASLWERHGDLARALQAARRRGGRHMDAPHYLASFLREEGRLAARLGDTVGAVRAYRHYLVHRRDPEPTLRPEVDRVRAELARLAGAR